MDIILIYKCFGGYSMPSIKSILTDIQTLPLGQVEQLLSYLEEYLVLGSQVGQVCLKL